jgi:CubicO group peptidase (beta-lactamase class C family)
MQVQEFLPDLSFLQEEVERTRAVLRDLLDHRSSQPYLLNEARERTRNALELFVEALVVRALPVPRKIHVELDLLRRLSAAGRPPGR